MVKLFAPWEWAHRLQACETMLRFHADRFVEVLNTLNLVESLMRDPKSLLSQPDMLDHFDGQVQRLKEQLEGMGLRLSAKMANRLHIGLTNADGEHPEAWAMLVTRKSEELRERVADELEGKAIYYISDHIDLLSEAPLFGEQVNDAFPSAHYDISEAGRCLALKRPTACVVHLMRALEVGLSSVAGALGIQVTTETWNTILTDIENEIRSRTKKTHGAKWKDEHEPFFAEAATHFRFIKNAWRNHAAHAKTKYTDEEAEEIYSSVRSFMRHLSGRLTEGKQSA